MAHLGPLYPGVHSEKNHTSITCTCLIYFILNIQLPCIKMLLLKHITLKQNTYRRNCQQQSPTCIHHNSRTGSAQYCSLKIDYDGNTYILL